MKRSIQCGIVLSEDGQITQRNLENTIFYSYNAEGQQTAKRVVPVDRPETTYTYENPENGNVVVTLPTKVISHSKTDTFGRKVFDELQLGTGFVSRQFSYHAGEITDAHKENAKLKSTATTQLVSQIVFSDGRTISYEYDGEERITKVIDSVDGTTEYTYDAQGQLLTEIRGNAVINKMTYDNYGNILSKNDNTYTYGDGQWKDLLTAYNGTAITYDAGGNPLTYRGYTFTWEKGRQLKSAVGNGKDLSYTYNANGIRTSKTVNGVTHTYLLEGTKILQETYPATSNDTDTNVVLQYLYDNEDSICGLIHNGTPYYFHKNLQGDIIAITDANGTVKATYSYDAWGVCTVTKDESDCKIATINPFRYRGYYMDVETGMYYLQSRYYDAEVGRFVNADDVNYLDASGTTLGCELFAYCSNNITNQVDPNGNIGLAIAIGLTVLVGATFLIAESNYKYNKKHEVKGYVYGQDNVNMKFARSTIEKSGCGIIATHNALVMLGKGKRLSEIVYYFDKRNAVTGNLWSAPFWDVDGCVKRYSNVSTKTTLFPKTYDSAIKKSKNKMGVVAYNWHYFLAKWDEKKYQFVMYNRYSNDTNVRYAYSIDKEVGEKKHLCLTTF